MALCLVGTWSAGVVAEPSASNATVTETADSLFGDAVAQFKLKNFAKALALFTRVSELKDSPNVRLYVGYCHVELGNDKAAHRAFTRAVELALESGDAKYVAARNAGQDQLTLLNLRLAKLTISIVAGQDSSKVSLDNEQLEPTQLGSPITVSPGLHHIVAESKGARPVVQDVELEKGGNKTVTLLFDKSAGVVAQPPPPPPTRTGAAPSSHGPHWTTYGLAASGLGLVGLGVFAVAGYQTRSTFQQLQTECDTGCSDGAHRNAIARGKTYQTVANVGLAAGAVGTLVGAALIYWGLTDEASAKPAVELNAGAMSISCEGSF